MSDWEEGEICTRREIASLLSGYPNWQQQDIEDSLFIFIKFFLEYIKGIVKSMMYFKKKICEDKKH